MLDIDRPLAPASQITASPLPVRCPLTMYDLPSEDPEEPGLPDEYHDLQPQLLSRTLQLLGVLADRVFTASDLNLYYDAEHPQWYKRPDWFLVVGVPRLYQGQDLRNSYVLWDEQVRPLLIVEFLSPSTEAADLGRFYEPKGKDATAAPTEPDQTPVEPDSDDDVELDVGSPPSKFVVYEEILQVLNYVVYDRHSQKLRYFRLIDGRYQEQSLASGNPRLWIPELSLGLGLWEGTFEDVPHVWLRWCDAEGNWCLTDTEEERSAKEAALWREMQERAAKEREQAAKERERAAKERERAAKEQERSAREAAEAALAEEQRLRQILADRLRAMGVDPDSLI